MDALGQQQGGVMKPLASCGKVVVEPEIPLQEALMEYSADWIYAFAAAEKGVVFIFLHE